MSHAYHWMPFFVDDYLADTTTLSTAEHGAYLLLIFAYWKNRGPLPDDEKILQKFSRLSFHKWKKISPVLKRFFQVKDGFWAHQRIDKEIELARVRHETRTARGRAGGLAKAHGKQAPSKAQACLGSATITHNPHKNIYKDGEIPVDLPAGFPTTEKEVLAIAGMVPVPNDFAIDTWHKAMSRGGHDAKDVPVRNFRSFLAIEWSYAKNREAEEKAKGARQSQPAPKKDVWDIKPGDCL